ncbi:MAG: ammonium transporter [Planctomycetota bacterium]
MSFRSMPLGMLVGMLVLGASRVASAQEATLDNGDNAWVLTCSALVLFVTAPGLAMCYGGLVRRKNVLGVIMQCLFLMGLMTVVWGLWGYSLAFGGSVGEPGYHAWIGNTDYLGMRDVAASWSTAENRAILPMEGRVPRLTHMVFQGMFFIVTPVLICGGFAERMRFSAMATFMLLWGTFVYCPLCHWVWDGGILAFGSPHALMGGVLDFAGGTVVHVSSGVSALVMALFMGKRLGFGQEDMRPHNLTYTAIGSAMLWVGWFGFTGGSRLAADGVAASAFVATHFAAAAGALAWVLVEWRMTGKPSVLGAASGIVAGLVCITPGSGFVGPMAAMGMGAIAGIICFFACTKLKRAFRYDDSLDAFGVYGVAGICGVLLTGVFASRAISNVANGAPLGWLEGGSILLGQLGAIAVTVVFTITATLIICVILNTIMRVRIDPEGEFIGLDQWEHGEEGYILH